MNTSFLGPFHPYIVHTPIVMLIFSAFFADGMASRLDQPSRFFQASGLDVRVRRPPSVVTEVAQKGRGTRERVACDRGVAGQHADRSTSSRRTQICPDDVATGYHSGTVSTASRSAAVTSAGSCGALRYAARSSRSATS